MKNIFSIDSPLMVFLSRVWDLIVLNLLFLIFSIPIVTIGVSTTALYRVLFNYHNGNDFRTIAPFWNAFRDNFKSSIILSLILLIPTSLLAYYLIFTFSGQAHTLGFLGIYVLATLIIAMIIAYVWPLQAHFHNTALKTLKNAVILALGHWGKSLIIAILNLFPILHIFIDPVSFLQMSPFWILIGFSAIAFLNSKIILSIFKKYISKDLPTPESYKQNSGEQQV